MNRSARGLERNVAVSAAVLESVEELRNMSPDTEDKTQSSYSFTPAELERLYVFRQAVLAGFYTDELPDEQVEQPDGDRAR